MLLGEYLCACKGPVASNHHEGIYPVGFHVVISLLPAFHSHEFLGAGGLEDCSSSLYCVADAF